MRELDRVPSSQLKPQLLWALREQDKRELVIFSLFLSMYVCFSVYLSCLSNKYFLKSTLGTIKVSWTLGMMIMGTLPPRLPMDPLGLPKLAQARLAKINMSASKYLLEYPGGANA